MFEAKSVPGAADAGRVDCDRNSVKKNCIGLSEMTENMQPDFNFLERVEAAGPFNVSACFQCRKCTNGCPAAFAMDFYPDQIIRMVILGQKDRVLRSNTIWVCATCETCTTRCPNDVKIAEVMDCLKEMSIREGIPAAQPQVRVLHESFLNNIRRHGRIFEGELLAEYIVRSGQLRQQYKDGSLMDQMRLGIDLLRKGRMSLIPHIRFKKNMARQILSKNIKPCKTKRRFL